MAEEDTEVVRSVQTDSSEADTPDERAKAYSNFRTTAHKFFDDNPTYRIASLSTDFTDEMAAKTQRGEYVALSRVKPGQKSPGKWYLQDITVIFPNEHTRAFEVAQVDYNFDPTDNTVRKRVIDIRNHFISKLEEKNGINNQPISASEAKRITNIITQSTPVKI